jgi:hypothetical protein
MTDEHDDLGPISGGALMTTPDVQVPAVAEFGSLEPRVQKSLVDLERDHVKLSTERVKLAQQVAGSLAGIIASAADAAAHTQKTNNEIRKLDVESLNRVTEIDANAAAEIETIAAQMRAAESKMECVRRVLDRVERGNLDSMTSQVLIETLKALR